MGSNNVANKNCLFNHLTHAFLKSHTCFLNCSKDIVIGIKPGHKPKEDIKRYKEEQGGIELCQLSSSWGNLGSV